VLGRSDRRLRLVGLLVIFIVLAGALSARLAYWQVVRAGELRTQALAQLEVSTKEPAERGEIFDSSGTVVLATTGYRDALAAYPDQIPAARLAETVARLTSILGLDEEGEKRIAAALKSDSQYAVLERSLTDEQSRAIREAVGDGRLKWVVLDPRPMRLYPSEGGAPDTTLASHLLGFANAESVGQYGVEQRYQNLLAGRPRIVNAQRDINGRPIAATSRIADPGRPGADLRLTVDASLQLQIEKELLAARIADQATTVTAVVLEPYTGNVLAWASVPGYDANQYGPLAANQPEVFLDPMVSHVYEPGSVLKMMVAGAGYESGAVTPDRKINDTGSIHIGRFRVDDADKRAMGWIPFEDVIAYSRNVGAVRAAQMLGDDVDEASTVLYDYWRRVGLGGITGVDVSGELPGIAANPAVDTWAEIDLANRAFGQGIAVTPLQLATSFATMVNGGERVQPRVVAAIGDEEMAPGPRERVIDEELSGELRRLMVHVVTKVPWYREGTEIDNYTVGGKTGTAQIWDSKRGDWVPQTFNFSFAGFVGPRVDEPRAVIAVRIGHTRPTIRGQGDFALNITSYELFRRIAIDTINALDIPPGPPSSSGSTADDDEP
jgi:cell division protein FtsI/penicillin-binding protein 2